MWVSYKFHHIFKPGCVSLICDISRHKQRAPTGNGRSRAGVFLEQERHQCYWWELGRSNRSWTNLESSFIKRLWFIGSNLFPSLTLPETPPPTNFPTHNRTSLLESWSQIIQVWKKKPLVRTQTSLTISQDSKKEEEKKRKKGKKEAQAR